MINKFVHQYYDLFKHYFTFLLTLQHGSGTASNIGLLRPFNVMILLGHCVFTSIYIVLFAMQSVKICRFKHVR